MGNMFISKSPQRMRYCFLVAQPQLLVGGMYNNVITMLYLNKGGVKKSGRHVRRGRLRIPHVSQGGKNRRSANTRR